MANLISGRITVTTAGTAVAGPTTTLPGWYAFSATGGNTGAYVYVGNDGADDVAAATGFGLAIADVVYLHVSKDLGELYFDVTTNGDTIDFIRVASTGFGPTA